MFYECAIIDRETHILHLTIFEDAIHGKVTTQWLQFTHNLLVHVRSCTEWLDPLREIPDNIFFHY